MRTVAALLVVLASACAVPGPTKSYRMPKLSVACPRDELIAAVKRHAWVRGWEVVSADDAAGAVEVVTTEERRGAIATRQRWSFRVQDGEVAVVLRLELYDADAGVWKSTGLVVCRSYDYAQELALLAEVKGAAQRALAIHARMKERR